MRQSRVLTVKIDELRADPTRWSFSFPAKGAREALRTSLERFGQLSPLAAIETPSGLELVDGAARLALLSELGSTDAFAIVLPRERVWDALLELRDASGEKPNPVEVGLYLRKRMADTGETPQTLAKEVFPALGLAPRPGACEDPLWLANLPAEDAERFASGEAPLAGVRVLAGAPAADALAALKAVRGVRLNSNKFVETTRWLCECAWKEKLTVAEWLAKTPLPAPEEGGDAFRNAVWRQRYPKLSEWSDSFDGDVKTLPLPKNATLSHATNFEGGRLKLTLSFATLAELAKSAAEVGDSAETGIYDELEKYLG